MARWRRWGCKPADPKGVQPIYAPAPIVREAALKAHANLPELLKPVFASLDGPTLQNSTRRSPWKAGRQTGGGRLPEREGLLRDNAEVPLCRRERGKPRSRSVSLTIAVKHRVLLTLFMLLLLAAFGLPFLSYAPNRLLSGKASPCSPCCTARRCGCCCRWRHWRSSACCRRRGAGAAGGAGRLRGADAGLMD